MLCVHIWPGIEQAQCQHWQVSISTLVPNCPVLTGVEEVNAGLIRVLVQWGRGRLHFWTNCCFSFVDAISLYVKLFSHVTARTVLESIMTSVRPFWGFWTINPEIVWNRLECWAINRSGMRGAGSHWAAEWSGTNDWHSRTADAGRPTFTAFTLRYCLDLCSQHSKITLTSAL